MMWLNPVILTQPITFGPAPDPAAMAVGAELFRKGKGADRALEGSRKVIATWYDSHIRRAADIAVWISPTMVSRWLGWLQADQQWSNAQVLARWAQIRDWVGNSMLFAVRLDALPKRDPWSFGTGEEADPANAAATSFRLSFDVDPARLHPYDLMRYHPSENRLIDSENGTLVASIEKEDPGPVLDVPFYAFQPFWKLFATDGAAEITDDGIHLGDYYASFYWVKFPLPQSLAGGTGFEFTISRPRRSVSVQFSLQAKG